MLELLGFCPPLGQFTVSSTEFSGSDLEVPPRPRPLVTANVAYPHYSACPLS